MCRSDASLLNEVVSARNNQAREHIGRSARGLRNEHDHVRRHPYGGGKQPTTLMNPSW